MLFFALKISNCDHCISSKCEIVPRDSPSNKQILRRESGKSASFPPLPYFSIERLKSHETCSIAILVVEFLVWNCELLKIG